VLVLFELEDDDVDVELLDAGGSSAAYTAPASRSKPNRGTNFFITMLSKKCKY
jgi:hypothetical protein